MTEIKENWKVILGYDNYMVSDLGRVKSLKRGIILKTVIKKGYISVRLSKRSKYRQFSVHRLIYCVFNNRPLDGAFVVRHLNDKKLDNSISNLKEGTHKDNADDRRRNGKDGIMRNGTEVWCAKLTPEKVKEIRALCGKYSHRQLGSIYGVSYHTIYCILNMKTWKHI